jgi:hypothetical protein
VRRAQAAWTHAGYWLSQSHNPFATRQLYGIRQISKHELFRFGRMSNYLKTMGMQSMSILSPVASVPSTKDNQKGKACTLTISDGLHPHVTQETMLMQLNNQDTILVLTDVSPYMMEA